MAVSGVFEWIWLDRLLPCAQSIPLLGLWFDASEGFLCHGYILWQWTGFSCSPFRRQVLQATHSWHIVGVELWRALSAWRLMGAILTFLPCKVPSNLSLHKDLSLFTGYLSAICFSDVSTPVSYRLCRNMWKLIWIREMSIEFWLLFKTFWIELKTYFKRRDWERLLCITYYFENLSLPFLLRHDD